MKHIYPQEANIHWPDTKKHTEKKGLATNHPYCDNYVCTDNCWDRYTNKAHWHTAAVVTVLSVPQKMKQYILTPGCHWLKPTCRWWKQGVLCSRRKSETKLWMGVQPYRWMFTCPTFTTWYMTPTTTHAPFIAHEYIFSCLIFQANACLWDGSDIILYGQSRQTDTNTWQWHLSIWTVKANWHKHM